jgi:hypothetical protein
VITFGKSRGKAGIREEGKETGATQEEGKRQGKEVRARLFFFFHFFVEAAHVAAAIGGKLYFVHNAKDKSNAQS